MRVPPPLILAAADYFVLTQIAAVAMGTRICAQILSGTGKAEWGSPREVGGFLLYRGSWREGEPQASSLAVPAASVKGDPNETECGRLPPPGDLPLSALGPFLRYPGKH